MRASRWNWIQGYANCMPLSKMEYHWLSKSDIIESLLCLRDSEVSRIKRLRELQSKDKWDGVCHDDLVIPRIFTVQAPHYRESV